jgi:hypothetical protein
VRQCGLRAGGRGCQIVRVGAQVTARSKLSLADQHAADLQRERQAKDLDLDVALSSPGFKRDGDLR